MIWAFDRQGDGSWDVADRFPLCTQGRVQKACEITDLDADGTLDLVAVDEDGVPTTLRCGAVDTLCTWVIEPRFEALGFRTLCFRSVGFSNGLAPVRLEGKWGAINTRGELVVEPIYENVKPFAGGTATARLFGEPEVCPERVRFTRHRSGRMGGEALPPGFIVGPRQYYICPGVRL